MNITDIKNYFIYKKVFIDGGTGSWGYELVKQLLNYGVEKIVVFSRNEFKQVEMQRYFNNSKLHFIIGDIRDYKALLQATKNIDIIIHLAALKHVPLCEAQPNEAILTNIIGTQNIIEAAINNHIKQVIDVSSDKAANPINVYGQTKAIGEKLCLLANNTQSTTSFTCIRAGNAVGSNGSVIPFFIDKIESNQPLPITKLDMTRYFMSLPEAIALILFASTNSNKGLFVTKMPSCTIRNLALVLIKRYGSDWYKHELKELGLRPGEKMHETLITNYEAPNTYILNDKLYINTTEELKYNKADFDEYTSNSQVLMSHSEITQMLENGGF